MVELTHQVIKTEVLAVVVPVELVKEHFQLLDLDMVLMVD
jgi:hypothetical protein